MNLDHDGRLRPLLKPSGVMESLTATKRLQQMEEKMNLGTNEVPRLLRPSEVMEALAINLETLWAIVVSQDLPVVCVEEKVRFDLVDLRAFVARQRVPRPAKILPELEEWLHDEIERDGQ